MRVTNREQLAQLLRQPEAGTPTPGPTAASPAPASPGLSAESTELLHRTLVQVQQCTRHMASLAEQFQPPVIPEKPKQLKATVHRDKDGRMSEVIISILKENP